MGMDVYGRNPKNEIGKYFRANVWSWHPLAQLCQDICTREMMPNGDWWHSNDGEGLQTQEECDVLAKELKVIAASMICEAVTLKSELRVEKGTGRILTGEQAAKVETESPYNTSKEKILSFAIFLESCGGFEIC